MLKSFILQQSLAHSSRPTGPLVDLNHFQVACERWSTPRLADDASVVILPPILRPINDVPYAYLDQELGRKQVIREKAKRRHLGLLEFPFRSFISDVPSSPSSVTFLLFPDRLTSRSMYLYLPGCLAQYPE